MKRLIQTLSQNTQNLLAYIKELNLQQGIANMMMKISFSNKQITAGVNKIQQGLPPHREGKILQDKITTLQKHTVLM